MRVQLTAASLPLSDPRHQGVTAANLVSQRMIASCGLIQDVAVVPLITAAEAHPAGTLTDVGNRP